MNTMKTIRQAHGLTAFLSHHTSHVTRHLLCLSALALCVGGCSTTGTGEAIRSRIESVELQASGDRTTGNYGGGAKFVLRDPRQRTTSDAK